MRTVSMLLLVLAAGSIQGCSQMVGGSAERNVLAGQDRRSANVYIEDEKIEIKTSGQIRDQIKRDMHVNLTSYNHKILLTGEVPDAAIRDEIGKIAASAENVLHVYNELVVSPNSSEASRNKDSEITAKVGTRLMKDRRFKVEPFDANHIKIVTENSTVFLAGIVSRAEGEAALDVAGSTSEVKRVVNLFDYLD